MLEVFLTAWYLLHLGLVQGIAQTVRVIVISRFARQIQDSILELLVLCILHRLAEDGDLFLQQFHFLVVREFDEVLLVE